VTVSPSDGTASVRDEELSDGPGTHPAPPLTHEIDTIDETRTQIGETWTEGEKVVDKERRGRDLDRDRFNLAAAILVLFVLSSAGVLVLLYFLPADKLQDLRALSPLILSPLATLAGTGFAWFYAERQNSGGTQ
jgi:hypothetical protein